jgi:hypothetical protein
MEGSINRRITVQVSPRENVRHHLKTNQSKWAGGVAQVVNHLPSECKVLISNLSIAKKKKKT